MWIDSAILVESVAGSDHVGVRREADGKAWLATWSEHEPEQITGESLAGIEPSRTFGSEWFGAGGLLPAGALNVNVEAPDGAWHGADIGGGAWSVIVPCPPWTDESLIHAVQFPPRVRFLDEHGSLVSRVTPRIAAASRRVSRLESLRRRVGPGGLPARCPVCGGREWQAVAAERESGERIFCRACGHSEHDGGKESQGSLSARPATIVVSARADLDDDTHAPRVEVEITNRLPEPNAVVACGVNVSRADAPVQEHPVAARLVDVLTGETIAVAPEATIVLSHVFDPVELRALTAQQAWPIARRPQLMAWAQSHDGCTTFAPPIDAHARWCELGWPHRQSS